MRRFFIQFIWQRTILPSAMDNTTEHDNQQSNTKHSIIRDTPTTNVCTTVISCDVVWVCVDCTHACACLSVYMFVYLLLVYFSFCFGFAVCSCISVSSILSLNNKKQHQLSVSSFTPFVYSHGFSFDFVLWFSLIIAYASKNHFISYFNYRISLSICARRLFSMAAVATKQEKINIG